MSKKEETIFFFSGSKAKLGAIFFFLLLLLLFSTPTKLIFHLRPALSLVFLFPFLLLAPSPPRQDGLCPRHRRRAPVDERSRCWRSEGPRCPRRSVVSREREDAEMPLESSAFCFVSLFPCCSALLCSALSLWCCKKKKKRVSSQSMFWPPRPRALLFPCSPVALPPV